MGPLQGEGGGSCFWLAEVRGGRGAGLGGGGLDPDAHEGGYGRIRRMAAPLIPTLGYSFLGSEARLISAVGLNDTTYRLDPLLFLVFSLGDVCLLVSFTD